MICKRDNFTLVLHQLNFSRRDGTTREVDVR